MGLKDTMKKAVKKVFGWLHVAENSLLVLILSSMMILAVSQIVMRNLLGTGVTWIDPVIRISVLWIAIVGAMIGTREGNHIAIDLLAQYAKGPLVEVVMRMVHLLSAGICGLMAWVSVEFVYDEWVYNTPSFGNLPAWPFEIILPLGFAVMGVRFAMKAIVGHQEAAT